MPIYVRVGNLCTGWFTFYFHFQHKIFIVTKFWKFTVLSRKITLYWVIVTRNLWLIKLSKIWLCFEIKSNIHWKISKNFKDSKSVFILFSSFNGCWVIDNFVIFQKIKVSKHMFNPCCHLATETGSWIYPENYTGSWFIMHAIIITTLAR